MVILIVAKALQDFRQNQIAGTDRLNTQQAIEFFSRQSFRAVEIIDPDRNRPESLISSHLLQIAFPF